MGGNNHSNYIKIEKVIIMARTGDSYVVSLGRAHLGWGDYRHTDTRGRRQGEAYLPIPIRYAREYSVYNSNATGGDVLGENIFNCQSVDGFLDCRMKAQGCIDGGEPFAKQFSAAGNLRTLGLWYEHVGATVGDRVRVTWTSEYDMIIEKL